MREKQKCRRYCSWNLEDLSDVERFLEKKSRGRLDCRKALGGMVYLSKR